MTNTNTILLIGIICQTSSSRNLAFTILYQLCESNISNLCRLLHIMENSANGVDNPSNDCDVYTYLLAKHHNQKKLLWDYGMMILSIVPSI